ncbi:MAG: alpha/beta hydrolase [Leptolyngbyaceae cyanobacterium SM2_5_2]|nr:alpha/beta hydrolase [Leptolyngbyaceae cyanobacterium SM2_5_2]
MAALANGLLAYSKARFGQARLWHYGLLAFASVATVLAATPLQAAEEILISYGILERTIAIADLEHFAETGQLTPQLRAYNERLQFSQEQLEQIRQALVTPAETLSHVAIAQFLYTEQGELLLNELTRVVRTPARQGDFSALRAALILGAARAEGGVTLLDVLRAYPIEAIRLELGEGFVIAQEINRAILQSERAVALVQDLSTQEANAAPLTPEAYSALLQLIQQQRRYQVNQATLVVPGLSRPAELYLPRLAPGQSPPPLGFPVVIISHGLGGTSGSYTYLANYLASGGIAVAAIEHAGSNDQQLLALLEGRADQVVPDEEFFRRPQEVSLTLNALGRHRTGTTNLSTRLDMTRIGVIGQSFGGYTALALAGAAFDPASLAQNCPPIGLTFNPSLLLQCQAAPLADSGQRLVDTRVGAIFIMNPIGSVLFGESGYGQIQIPVMMVGSTADTIAPVFPEQIRPFTWLTTPERYLLLLNQGTHFSVVGDVALPEQPSPSPRPWWGLGLTWLSPTCRCWLWPTSSSP